MASFITVLNAIVTTLQSDADLAAFCTDKWNKTLSVQKVFKRRTEVNISDLPVILITRPTLRTQYFKGSNLKDGVHGINLYCGFHQVDKTKALEEFIEFEEKITDALLGNFVIVTDPEPATAMNDEGEFHPVYFMVMNMNIKFRRN